MKKFWKTAGSVAVWVGIAAYLVWAARQYASRQRDLPAAGVEVVVRDSARLGVITPGMVKGWIAAEELIPRNSAAREVQVERIQKLVRSRGFVKTARTYMDMDGKVHVSLLQRQPMMRFSTSSGYNFYITEDRWALPAQPHAAVWLPVVTGNYVPPFPRNYAGPLETDEKKWDENYRFLYNLINFVEFIRNDAFWSAYTEQIHVTVPDGGGREFRIYNPQVEIVPRAGNHIVMLGELDGYQEKLDKLLTFYRNGLAYEGWDAYGYINLRYRNQIVCTK